MAHGSFHATVHVRPPDATTGRPIELAGRQFQTLQLAAPPNRPFDISFEDAAEALSELDRLFLEPDGSFVWVSPAGDLAWQLDGVLYDRAGHLLYVELKGTCHEQPFDRFLSALGWPRTTVMFQLVRAAVFLDEAQFRRQAGWHA